MSEDEFLSESTLGTKQYWDQFYDEELTNFQDHGDTGETWFGKRNALKIVNWIVENVNKDGIIFLFLCYFEFWFYFICFRF